MSRVLELAVISLCIALAAHSGKAAPAGENAVNAIKEYQKTKLQPLWDALNLLADSNVLTPEEAGEHNLHRIIVTGDQSVGKSSVLEAISGVVLPKGTEGRVTRSPILLQLRDGEPGSKTSAVFKYKDARSGAMISVDVEDPTDSQIVTKRYESIMARLGLRAGEVTDQEIVYMVTKPSMPPLTLLDLPGLIQLGSPAEKDRNKLSQSINAMVERYLSVPNSIVLIVYNAYVDEENVASLKWDKCCNGRVLLVANFFEGKAIPEIVEKFKFRNAKNRTNKGVVGVRLPSFEEAKLPFSRMKEIADADYEQLAQRGLRKSKESGTDSLSVQDLENFKKRCGIETLLQTLLEVQDEALKTHSLINVQKKVQAAIRTKRSLLEMSKIRLDQPMALVNEFGGWSDELMKRYQRLTRSRFFEVTNEDDMWLMYQVYVAETTFYKAVNAVVTKFTQDPSYVGKIVKQAAAYGLVNSKDDLAAFELVINPLLEHLEAPSFQLVDQVEAVVSHVLRKLVRQEHIFPNQGILHAVLDININAFCRERAEQAKQDVQTVLRRLRQHITQNPDYAMRYNAVMQMLRGEQGGQAELLFEVVLSSKVFKGLTDFHDSMQRAYIKALTSFLAFHKVPEQDVAVDIRQLRQDVSGSVKFVTAIVGPGRHSVALARFSKVLQTDPKLVLSGASSKEQFKWTTFSNFEGPKANAIHKGGCVWDDKLILSTVEDVKLASMKIESVTSSAGGADAVTDAMNDLVVETLSGLFIYLKLLQDGLVDDIVRGVRMFQVAEYVEDSNHGLQAFLKKNLLTELPAEACEGSAEDIYGVCKLSKHSRLKLPIVAIWQNGADPEGDWFKHDQAIKDLEQVNAALITYATSSPTLAAI